ncbi:hypothetical protein BU15DRAFT_67207 [Melanogaster broomeanus]|nr:hypothetical protein BU15DRAFT_67207 [Melanogaster broomeanus]
MLSSWTNSLWSALSGAPAVLTHTCQRQLLESHVKDTCQYVTVPRPEEGCDQSILRRDRGNRVDICVHRSTQCDGCSVPVKHAALNDHNLECSSKTSHDHTTACPEVTVSCIHADNGCSWTGPRRELSELHIPSCSYQSINGFFAISSTRMSTHSAENTIVHVMQREIQSLKTILGPWYRCGASPGGPRVQDDSTFQGFSGPSTSRTVSRCAQALFASDSFDTILPSSHTTDAEHDTLAAYFPLPSSDAVYEPHHHNRMHAHRASLGRTDMPAHPVQRSLLLTAAVAPLNLSTSLEGFLVGLRESIAAVSASVDSLSRRDDIALTNESMRIKVRFWSGRCCSVRGADNFFIRFFAVSFPWPCGTVSVSSRLLTWNSIVNSPEQLHRLMMDRTAQVTGRLGGTSSGSGRPTIDPFLKGGYLFHYSMHSITLVAVLMSVWLAQRKTRSKFAGGPILQGPKGLLFIILRQEIVIINSENTARVRCDEWGNIFVHRRKPPLYGMFGLDCLTVLIEPGDECIARDLVSNCVEMRMVPCWRNAFLSTTPLFKRRVEKVLDKVFTPARSQIPARRLARDLVTNWCRDEDAAMPAQYLHVLFPVVVSHAWRPPVLRYMATAVLEVTRSREGGSCGRCNPRNNALGKWTKYSRPLGAGWAFPVSQPKMTFMKGATSRKGVISPIRTSSMLIASYYRMDNSSHKPSRLASCCLDPAGEIEEEPVFTPGDGVLSQPLGGPKPRDHEMQPEIDAEIDASTTHRKRVSPEFACKPQGLCAVTCPLSAPQLPPDGHRVHYSDFLTLPESLYNHPHTALVVSMFGRPISTEQPADSVQKPVEIWTFDDGGSDAIEFEFFADGKRLLGWDGKSVKVWMMEERVSEVVVMGSDTRIIAAAVFPDGKRVLTGHERGWLKVWDCETGKILEVWKTDNEDPAVHDDDFVFSPNGDYVATGDDKRQVSLWRPPGWDKTRQLPAVILPVQTHRSPDYLDILDLPATSRPPVSGPAASRPTSTLAGLRTSLKSIRQSFRGDQPKVTPIYQGKAPAHRASHPAIYQRHAAAEETPRRPQLPADMPTTPGHYGTYTILAAAPPTDTRSPDDDPDSPDDGPNEVTAETTGHAAFCGLCSTLPFRRSKHPNNSGARKSVVEIPRT